MARLNKAVLQLFQQALSSLRQHVGLVNDPACRQLLEGTALMIAQTQYQHQQFNQQYQQTLWQYLLPQAFKPFPAMSVCQIHSEDASHYPMILPANTEFQCQQGEHMLPLQTKQAITLTGAYVEQLDWRSTTQNQRQLDITIRFPYSLAEHRLTTLPMFIHADPELCYQIFHVLWHPQAKVLVTQSDTETTYHSIKLIPEWLTDERDAFELLQQFILNPYTLLRLAFVFNDDMPWHSFDDSIRLTLTLPESTNDVALKLSKQHLLFDCVDMVCQFNALAKPFRYQQPQKAYPLTIDSGWLNAQSRLASLSLVSAHLQNGEQIELAPMHGANYQRQHNPIAYWLLDKDTNQSSELLIEPIDEAKLQHAILQVNCVCHQVINTFDVRKPFTIIHQRADQTKLCASLLHTFSVYHEPQPWAKTQFRLSHVTYQSPWHEPRQQGQRIHQIAHLLSLDNMERYQWLTNALREVTIERRFQATRASAHLSIVIDSELAHDYQWTPLALILWLLYQQEIAPVPMGSLMVLDTQHRELWQCNHHLLD